MSKVLTPYGIYYYLRILDEVKNKLEESMQRVFYVPPSILQDLSKIAELKEVKNLEEIGKWADEWVRYVRDLGYLDRQSCKSLLEQTVVYKNKFVDMVMKLVLITPNLQVLDIDKVRKGASAFFSKSTLKWLKDIGGLVEFNHACISLLANLPTAAGFYLLRLCERVLRELYRKETGKDVSKHTWGAILDELEKYYENKESVSYTHLTLPTN